MLDVFSLRILLQGIRLFVIFYLQVYLSNPCASLRCSLLLELAASRRVILALGNHILTHLEEEKSKSKSELGQGLHSFCTI